MKKLKYRVIVFELNETHDNNNPIRAVYKVSNINLQSLVRKFAKLKLTKSNSLMAMKSEKLTQLLSFKHVEIVMLTTTICK